MTYRFEQLPGEPIVLFSPDPDHNFIDELEKTVADALTLLDGQPEQVFMVIDLTGVSMSVGEILAMATATAQGRAAPLHHRGIRENVFITTDPMMTMGIRGLASATFGHVRYARFDSVDHALDYCRQMIAETKPNT